MVVIARGAYPIVWLLVAIAPSAAIGAAFLFVALFLQGLAAARSTRPRPRQPKAAASWFGNSR